MTVDPKATALLLIDIQNDYWLPPREPRERFLRSARELLELARETGVMVVHVQQARKDASRGTFVAGTPGFEIRDEVAPIAGETRVVKHTPGSFYETGLDELLRGAGIRHLLISGLQTQKCCDTTTREASARGYRPLFVMDAVDTFDLVGPDGERVSRDDVNRATFATLSNGFADVVRLRDVHELLRSPVQA